MLVIVTLGAAGCITVPGWAVVTVAGLLAAPRTLRRLQGSPE